MSLSAGQTELASAMKNLLVAWAEVQQVWKDVMAQEFETSYIKPAENMTRGTLGAFGQIGPQLQKMLHDIS
jgi:hypothetical protein